MSASVTDTITVRSDRTGMLHDPTLDQRQPDPNGALSTIGWYFRLREQFGRMPRSIVDMPMRSSRKARPPADDCL